MAEKNTDSNFFLVARRRHGFDEINLSRIEDRAIREHFETYISGMEQVLYVIQSPFNVMLYAKLNEQANQAFMRNRLLSKAAAIRGDYEDDTERILEDARKRTHKELEENPVDSEEMITLVAESLRDLEEDEAVHMSNSAALRQSVPVIWSTTETLVKDIARTLFNKDAILSAQFLEDQISNPFWRKGDIKLHHIAEHNFDVAHAMGDIIFEIHPCNSPDAMSKVCGFLFSPESNSKKMLKSGEVKHLYLTRNVISHRNGIVDAHHKRLSNCNEAVGQRLAIGVPEVESAYAISKQLAIALYQDNASSQG